MYHRPGICERDHQTLALEVENKLRIGNLRDAYDQVYQCLIMRQDKANQYRNKNQGHTHAINIVEDLLKKIIEIQSLRTDKKLNDYELDSLRVNYIASDFKVDYKNRKGFIRQVFAPRNIQIRRTVNRRTVNRKRSRSQSPSYPQRYTRSSSPSHPQRRYTRSSSPSWQR